MVDSVTGFHSRFVNLSKRMKYILSVDNCQKILPFSCLQGPGVLVPLRRDQHVLASRNHSGGQVKSGPLDSLCKKVLVKKSRNYATMPSGE